MFNFSSVMKTGIYCLSIGKLFSLEKNVIACYCTLRYQTICFQVEILCKSNKRMVFMVDLFQRWYVYVCVRLKMLSYSAFFLYHSNLP